MKKDFLKKRFEKHVSLTLHCRIVTPMFLGDAEQKAALRPEPFKGLLRYWWRVAAGWKDVPPKKLLEDESRIFGGGGDEAQKSLVTIEVEGNPRVIEDPRLPKVQDVYHPEVGRSGRRINPLLYLGYGPVLWKQGQARYDRPYLEPGENFSLKITFPESLVEDETFKLALLYFCAFGAVGSRSRNGWGSFQVEKIDAKDCLQKIWDESFIETLEKDLPCWKDCFDKPYPHTLAKGEDNKLLLWRAEGFESWQEAMKLLAEVYIYVRTGHVPLGYSWSKKAPLDPDDIYNIGERHLLGFPLTNHPAQNAGWGYRKPNGKIRYEARLASPLLFLVRKYSDAYQIFILHLPYYLDPEFYLKSNKKTSWLSKKQQIEIWQKVHQRLDHAMTRASINECL